MMPEEQYSELSSTLYTPVCECTYANMFMRTCIHADTLICTYTQTHTRMQTKPCASMYIHQSKYIYFAFVLFHWRGGNCTKALGIVDESSITELHPTPVKSFKRETAALAEALFGNSVSVLRVFSLLILLGSS